MSEKSRPKNSKTETLASCNANLLCDRDPFVWTNVVSRMKGAVRMG